MNHYLKKAHIMITQNPSPYDYQIEKNKSGLTNFAGLPVWMDLIQLIRLFKIARQFLGIPKSDQGFCNGQILASLILLQIAEGESVDDIETLRQDDGFSRCVRRIALSIFNRRKRRKKEREYEKMEICQFPLQA